MTSGDFNIDISEKYTRHFRNDFWRAFEGILLFLATMSKSQVRKRILPPPPLRYQVVGKSRAPSGRGLTKLMDMCAYALYNSRLRWEVVQVQEDRDICGEVRHPGNHMQRARTKFETNLITS